MVKDKRSKYRNKHCDAEQVNGIGNENVGGKRDTEDKRWADRE